MMFHEISLHIGLDDSDTTDIGSVSGGEVSRIYLVLTSGKIVSSSHLYNTGMD